MYIQTAISLRAEEEELPAKESAVKKCSLSNLPLSPVNCNRSVQVDQMICSLAKEGKHFVVTAPLLCAECGQLREEKYFIEMKDGVVMCTLGLCKMQLNTYRCSGCTNMAIPEGRDHCLVIENTATTAAHAILRREVIGAALSNGTLTGRLRHFHSQVINNISSCIIPQGSTPHSVDSMKRLYITILQLMTKSPPPPFLFAKIVRIMKVTQGKGLLAYALMPLFPKASGKKRK